VATDWSQYEVAATVADYLDMLERELRGKPYNKSKHNRRLQLQLTGRSPGAIEFKHQNISAILLELGFPYIDGYKPRGNYQELLKSEVQVQLNRNPQIETATQALVDAPVESVMAEIPAAVFVAPPVRMGRRRVYEKYRPTRPTEGVNYLERESRNRFLGLAGELLVLKAEHRRLWYAGRKRLAERIEHVAVSQGDGLGYDVESFEVDGRKRFIEVKTTAFGALTPFFATANEVAVSDTLENFQLYRVFRFRKDARIFCLPGSLSTTCELEPTQFRASLL
jgi:hypothetical protein